MNTIDTIVDTLQSSCLPTRGLLRLSDLSEAEFALCLDLAAALKRAKGEGQRGRRLAGLNIALIFEKMSTRTRAAAAVAVADEGGVAHYMAAGEIHLGKKESVKDTARVLGRLFDGILFRGFAHRTVEELADHAGIPVWNGLTDAFHPTQTLADLLTVRECFGTLTSRKLVYIGDGSNNVANSLMEGCAKTGMNFVNCSPPALAPQADLVARAAATASRTGGSIAVCHDPVAAVEGANVIYTDVWTSMGEEAKREERLAMLRPYQIDMALLKRTGQLENNNVIFLHCLPAFHDHQTALSADTGAQEVTDEVFEAPFSKVFDQAENRMHTIKAMILGSLAVRPQTRKATS